MEEKLIEKTIELEEAFNKTTDSALQLMEINKEHQRINGELREENKRLQEEFTYMTKKAYDFFSALMDIKHYIDNEWNWDGTGIDIIENIVEEALVKDMVTKETIEKLRKW